MNNILGRNEKKKIIFKSLFYVIIVAFTVIFDQITKKLAVDKLKPIYDYPIIKDVLHFTYVENKGAAFGMLRDSRWVFMIASSVAIVVLVAVAVLYSKKLGIVADTGIAFIIGGGIGNMIDRVAIGYVIDFINVELINFAVFNVADSFVCIGVALLFVHILFIEDGGVFANKRGVSEKAEDSGEFDATSDDGIENVSEKFSEPVSAKLPKSENIQPKGIGKTENAPTGRIIRAGNVHSVQKTNADTAQNEGVSKTVRGVAAALRAEKEALDRHSDGDSNIK